MFPQFRNPASEDRTMYFSFIFRSSRALGVGGSFGLTSMGPAHKIAYSICSLPMYYRDCDSFSLTYLYSLDPTHYTHLGLLMSQTIRTDRWDRLVSPLPNSFKPMRESKGGDERGVRQPYGEREQNILENLRGVCDIHRRLHVQTAVGFFGHPGQPPLIVEVLREARNQISALIHTMSGRDSQAWPVPRSCPPFP